MRTLTNLLAIGLLSFTALHAQESNMSSTVKASEMYADGFSKFRFGGYGEMAASYMDYDWNWVTPQGTSHMNRATVSIPADLRAFGKVQACPIEPRARRADAVFGNFADHNRIIVLSHAERKLTRSVRCARGGLTYRNAALKSREQKLSAGNGIGSAAAGGDHHAPIFEINFQNHRVFAVGD